MAPGILIGGPTIGEAGIGTVPTIGGGYVAIGSGDGPCNSPGGSMTGATGAGVPKLMIFYAGGTGAGMGRTGGRVGGVRESRQIHLAAGR